MSENKRTDMWIQLHGSCYYDFAEPSLDNVTIEAIAHSLAYQCRFNGSTRRFYSVAEHSLWVRECASMLARSKLERGAMEALIDGINRGALLHDAAEAIVTDIPRPLRKMPICSGLNDEIARVERLIQERWEGLYCHPVVREADLILLHTEKVQLLHAEPRPWPGMPEPMKIRLGCWSPEEAKSRFLHECRRLGIG
jgi:hypothetical protein